MNIAAKPDKLANPIAAHTPPPEVKTKTPVQPKKVKNAMMLLTDNNVKHIVR